MLILANEQKISPYSLLYDKIISKDNFLRQIKEKIDFSFVNKLLENSYCKEFGRPAKEPEMMFKLLFLQRMYDLSDRELIERVKVDMSFKFFLDLMPEDEVVDPSLLSKFRRSRINSEEILEEMISETVRQAIEKKLIKGNAIMIDATHSKSKGIKESPTQMLRRYSKELRKEIYTKAPELAKDFPEKPLETSTLEEEFNYTKKLIEGIKDGIINSKDKGLQKKYNKVKELIDNEKIKEIQSLSDEDAKLGYKSENNSFFGYKNHIAMTEERIITGLEITNGEAPDGKYYETLVEKSMKNGLKVTEVLADRAYSGKDNLDYSEKNKIALISRLNPIISNVEDKSETDFEYIKDADTMRCKAGHLAIKKTYDKEKIDKKHKYKNARIRYSFDVKKCRECPFREGCYTPESKKKTYCVTLMSNIHKQQLEFQETDYFKNRITQRYMIEAKNAELKQSHGLDRCKYNGLLGMKIQSYLSAFVVNAKRIMKLIKKSVQSRLEVCPNI